MNKEQMAEIRTYKIYKHTLIDGSVYIGVTSAEKLYDRFGYKSGYYAQPFGKAIEECGGWKNVKTEILEEITGTWYEAHDREIYWIDMHIKCGVELWNKDHTHIKEKKYKRDGVTLTDINRYFVSLAEAARYIGVTRAAIHSALKEGRPCKGYSLEYGDVTKKETKENEM